MAVTESKRELDTADVRRLMDFLPHRYPFLLVDRIVAIDGDNSATGIKNVTANEPHFMGHFPGNPIMPGVLIVEAMAQTAGAICLFQYVIEEKFIVLFMTIDHAKFRRPVVPGDQLRIHVKKLKKRDKIFRFSCVAEVEGEKVAEAELTAMITKDRFYE